MDTVSKHKTLISVLISLTLFIVSPFVLPVYWTMILTEILIMGLFAMSFNLLFGYTGLLSFGQAGFFGVGAYATALFLSKGGNSLLVGLAARRPRDRRLHEQLHLVDSRPCTPGRCRCDPDSGSEGICLCGAESHPGRTG